MSDLTSCYFCGTALDAPVERYPLTPPSIDAATGRSVALCPTCRRKLVKVLEIVGEEFDAVVDEDGARADHDEAADAADATATTPSTADGDDASEDTTTSAGAPDPESATQATAAETTVDDTAAADSPEEADTGADDAATAGADPDEDEAAADSPAEDSTGDDPPAERSKSTDVDPVAATDPTAGGARGSSTTETGTETAAAADAGNGGKPELLSTPAAQKVIKLLQNRAFPLEREEFEIVASNAYDIPMGDCEEVIDTLVAEGYVAEDGPMLTRPE